MARKVLVQKHFPKKDIKYDNFIVGLLVNRIMKGGKKKLAFNIIYQTFKIIEEKIKTNPILILEKAIKNISPRVKLKSKRVSGATYQVPVLLTNYESAIIAIRWLIQISRKRYSKNMAIKLSNEILDASKGIGNVIRKKEETHKMAEGNKPFLQLKYH